MNDFSSPPRTFRLYAIVHALEEHLTAQLDPLLALAHFSSQSSSTQESRPGSPMEFLRSLAERGYGGIVANVSFANYLRDEKSWQILRQGLQAARELGLVVWLYDEHGYPSGTAGGLVLEGHPELQATGVAYCWQDGQGPCEMVLPLLPAGQLVYAAAAPLSGATLRLQEAHDLTDRASLGQPLRWLAPAGHWRLMAFVAQPLYEGTHGQTNFWDKRPCINLLDRRATERFVALTHEAYARRVGDFFGTTVRAFFTDEPSLMAGFVGEQPMPFAAIPWVDALPRLFRERYGHDLIPALPALFNDVGAETGKVRAQFYDLVARTCADAYFGVIQDWCQAHGLASSGHLLWEEFLLWHVAFEGSAFAALRRMDIPGMDRLSSNPRQLNLDDTRPVSWLLGPGADELRAQASRMRSGSYADIIQALKGWVAPKLVSSIAHVTGASQVMIEVSSILENWREERVSVADVRATLNWLYALGINTVTSYYDWKAFSPSENSAINEHAGRLGVMLTQGKHVADIAVLYPVTGIWPHYIPTRSHVREMEQSAPALELNDALDEISRLLLTHQRDFDYLDDAALAEATIEDGALCVHEERYRLLVLPPLDMIRRATMEKIRAFQAAGGKVIAVGRLPHSSQEMGPDPLIQSQVEGIFGTDAQNKSAFLVQEAQAIVPVLENLSPDLSISPPSSHILYHHRRAEERDIYFLVNHDPTVVSLNCHVRVKGKPTLWNPLTGESGLAIPHTTTLSETEFPLRMEGFSSLFIVFESPRPRGS